eukprot:TRINITY_DN17559_c0_g1_i1.p1 TRINITY_DN17559_c0_g1~~TRINITY_DN17559_c0_g1_i1.p1  ORF type:complete len:303 (-),score=68.14 TRINITY_DN17559_c0_g1_i1:426-1334(-)
MSSESDAGPLAKVMLYGPGVTVTVNSQHICQFLNHLGQDPLQQHLTSPPAQQTHLPTSVPHMDGLCTDVMTACDSVFDHMATTISKSIFLISTHEFAQGSDPILVALVSSPRVRGSSTNHHLACARQGESTVAIGHISSSGGQWRCSQMELPSDANIVSLDFYSHESLCILSRSASLSTLALYPTIIGDDADPTPSKQRTLPDSATTGDMIVRMNGQRWVGGVIAESRKLYIYDMENDDEEEGEEDEDEPAEEEGDGDDEHGEDEAVGDDAPDGDEEAGGNADGPANTSIDMNTSSDMEADD